MSIRVPAGSRTLYVDLGQNKDDGSRFLSIHEVHGNDRDEQSRILVDEAYVAELHRALTAVLAMLEPNYSTKSYTLAEKRGKDSRA